MKSVCITGASRGLGKTTAELFFKSGWNVALISRKREMLGEVAEKLHSKYRMNRSEILVIDVDLSAPGAPKYCVDVMRDHWPAIHALVNNAGIQGPIGRFCDIDPVTWEEAFKILLFAPLDMCRHVIPWMLSSGGGDIINISGGGAAGPRENFTAYAAAKTALVRTTEILSLEYGSQGIAVNAVAPGAMPTGILQEILDAGSEVVGRKEYDSAIKTFEREEIEPIGKSAAECIFTLCNQKTPKITGKLISAVWDDYEDWPNHLDELKYSDLYTLRRITGRDRGKTWGDK
jgi:3-oxoacyl-[acyl-carrier protein] reductase